MSINQRQYQQLSEMGISLWQHRPEAFQNISSNKNPAEQNVNYLKQNNESLVTLSEQAMFTDVLLALELSIGEVTAQQDHLDLGFFNWFFYAEQSESSAIQCSDNKLFTPSIELIRNSADLKKQLWQTITTNLI